MKQKSLREYAQDRVNALRAINRSHMTQEESDVIDDCIRDYDAIVENEWRKYLARMAKEGMFNA